MVMIAEEIAKAKQDKQKIISISLIIILLLSLSSAVLLFVVSKEGLLNQEEIDKTQVDGTPELVKLESAKQSPVIDSPVEGEINSAEARQTYLNAFSRFENDLKPALDSIDIITWDKTRSDKLTVEENDAVKTFSEGQYSTAIQAINTLIKTAQETIASSSSIFNNAMQQASSNYSANDYLSARMAIDTALIHDAASEAAQALAKQIQKLPQITKLDEAIQVAKIENNTAKELDLIEQLLTLDSNRSELKQRADFLRVMQKKSRFKQAINQANNAIKAKQLDSAKQAIDRAKSIYPSDAQVSSLAFTISQLESQQRFDSYQQQGDKARNSDDWLTAKQKYTLALKEQASDKALLEKIAQADRIISLNADIAKLLKSPHRLSNSLLKSKAELTLIKASGFSDSSASLNSSARQLKSMITAANTLIPVTVLSDGQTFVQVRGLGIVGETNSKVIELKPGSYKFEGKRQGYKSKLIDVTIPLNKPSLQITVIADERI